ncbi:endoplasmic reticulum lectin 1 isoform X2 [Oenanthe melanoleuca]|uniref:endoplasmic reticulum lectin 1 isoform X2 n=1 Tax=Oenanthe melanoleuca TaxID=2939378 RepID=UPI0024C13ED2|nr:endoplasmic reticulum lectin 1 isoform X2 [Oenanthe melanoleuca]
MRGCGLRPPSPAPAPRRGCGPRPPCPAPALLCGLLAAVAAVAEGGRALPQLSDDIPFRVNWPGTELSLPTTGVLYKEDNYIIMTTVDKEKYKCLLPLIASGNEEEEKDYKGPTPGELLEPLFKQSSCSYRIESYWTYEVCHGKHIRQYHEEKETGQKINIQEYYLGNMIMKNPLSEPDQEEKESSKDGAKEIPTKNIEGQMTPYYPVELGNGTPCSLRQNLPRSSTVMYICHPEAKHEILSVAEVTTCEYEVVILTPLLCSHPKYRYRALRDPKHRHRALRDPRHRYRAHRDPRHRYRALRDPRHRYRALRDPRHRYRALRDPRHRYRAHRDPRHRYRALRDPRHRYRALSHPKYRHRALRDPRHRHRAHRDPRHRYRAHRDPRHRYRAHRHPKYRHRALRDPRHRYRALSHPKYRFRASPVNDIFCQSLPGSPLKPHNLQQLEKQQEMLKMPFRRVKEEEMPSTKEEKFSSIHKPVAVGSHQLLTVGTTHISKLTDEQLIKEFLSGSYCFHGGVGWWKYEFCYGKYVHQYHEDKESGKTSVVVGTWSKEEHMEWSRKNAARTFYLREDGTQTVRMVSHFYGNGDVCDLTDKPRQVTVKLKCKESDSPHAVTIYMLEPHSCQYILGVESPVICKILDTADEYGLLSVPS